MIPFFNSSKTPAHQGVFIDYEMSYLDTVVCCGGSSVKYETAIRRPSI